MTASCHTAQDVFCRVVAFGFVCGLTTSCGRIGYERLARDTHGPTDADNDDRGVPPDLSDAPQDAPESEGGDLPPTGAFSYRRTLTIAATRLGGSCGSPLTDFPMLVSVAGDTLLRPVSAGGHVQSDNGFDISFTESDGRPLEYEIESYDGASGALVAWVRLGLSPSSDTVVLMLYGRTGVDGPLRPPSAAWSSDFGGVWHLAESPSDLVRSSIRDATSNGNHGVPERFGTTGGSTGAMGLIGGADRFAPTEAVITIDHAPSQTPINDMTLSMWVNFRTVRHAILAQKNDATSPYLSYQLYVTGGWFFFGAYTTLASDYAYQYRTDPVVTGVWYHIAGVIDGDQVILYVDGSTASTIGSNPAPGTLVQATSTLTFGNDTGYAVAPDATVDEVRLSNVARSRCWLETEVSNQRFPSTFVAIGAEEANGGG